MRVYEGLDKFEGLQNSALTIGTFDGVHIGHQKVIKQLKAAAKSIRGEAVILTFYPHPRMVLFPDDISLRLLTTEEEKKELLSNLGVDHLVIQPFTTDFSRISYTEYVRDILVNKLKTKKLIIGHNHQFGRNREGSFEELKKLAPIYGFGLERISAEDVNKVEISSTKIRKALAIGEIKKANKYLGYAYGIQGVVVKGRGLGKELGYPTANIGIENKYKLIPADGIYAVEIGLDDKMHKGMLSIGLNPTISDSGHRTIEVNIFDFQKDIYGSKLRIFFKDKLRNEEKFDNLEDLKKALAADKINSLKILNK